MSYYNGMQSDEALKGIETVAGAGGLSAEAAKQAADWLAREDCALYRDEILAMIEAEAFDDIEAAFGSIIPFGTGGRRGRRGAGPNRINFVTISESAQGVCNYLAGLGDESRCVIIAFDTRHYSDAFAQCAAEVFAANGVQVYIFDGPRATPELSFAVRQLKADVGIVISASHNPPSDNGIKIYWSHGGQVVPPHDEGIIAEVMKGPAIKRLAFDDAAQQGLVEVVGSELDEGYWSAVCAQSVLSDPGDTHIVFTAMHGTGATSVVPILERMGYRVDSVAEQNEPNGDFPNVVNHLPNPEYPETLELAISQAKKQGADLVMGTDPDADRIGAAVPVSAGSDEWVTMTGNQISALITEYVLATMAEQGQNLAQRVVAKSVVTTNLIKDICAAYGAQLLGELPVGFKYIAQVVEADPEAFLVATEESHGVLKGAHARDKDAGTGALMLAELVAALKKAGRTAAEQLDELYARHGYYCDALESVVFPGGDVRTQNAKMMASLRAELPAELGGVTVRGLKDYLLAENAQAVDGVPIELMQTDAVRFILSDDGRTHLTIRPSGTEPKVKVYAAVYAAAGDDLAAAKAQADASAARMIDDARRIIEAAVN